MRDNHLFTFHPSGVRSSFEFFPNESWIDFHALQTGHKAGNPDYEKNLLAYALKNVKHHINAEPNYEGHPNDFKPMEKGWMDDFDTKGAAYWNMLSGVLAIHMEIITFGSCICQAEFLSIMRAQIGELQFLAKIKGELTLINKDFLHLNI